MLHLFWIVSLFPRSGCEHLIWWITPVSDPPTTTEHSGSSERLPCWPISELPTWMCTLPKGSSIEPMMVRLLTLTVLKKIS